LSLEEEGLGLLVGVRQKQGRMWVFGKNDFNVCCCVGTQMGKEIKKARVISKM
jgi:hypothetical protein